jgi:non-lysosomal glucosylceramidase
MSNNSKRVAKGPDDSAGKGTGSSADSCCGSMNRRDFVMRAGAGLAGAVQLASSRLTLAADPEARSAVDHYVPELKNLDPGWLRKLYLQNDRTALTGAALDTLGMPCGGIASGQLYVRGDGTLAHWWIANDAYDTGPGLMQQVTTTQGTYEQGYHTFRPYSPLSQGFAVETRDADGTVRRRRLDRTGFDDINFFGEYPVATIDYNSDERPDLPVGVRAEVFSPFIPLNTRDSAIPVTILRFSVSNRTERPIDAALVGWLQNGVFRGKRGRLQAATRNRLSRSPGMTTILMDSVPMPDAPLVKRQIRVFEDFETGDYADWQVQGDAFGTAPATGALPGQQLPPLPIEIDWDTSIGDWQGEFFANSFHGGYEAKGRLTSKPFVVENRYIVFKISGGFDFRKTSINLSVDGKLVRSAGGAFLDLKLRDRYWDVTEFIGKQARLFVVDAGGSPADFINVDRIYFSDVPPLDDELWSEQHPQHGNMALTALDDEARAWTDCGSVDDFLQTLADGGAPESHAETKRDLSDDHIAGLGSSFSLSPGESKTRTFLVTWYFPNRPLSNTRMGFSSQVPAGKRVGNRYEVWYEDSRDVAAYVADNLDRLVRETMLFRDTYFESTLPYWFLQRVAMPLSTLATETCQWWSNGRFWAFEGVGCCVGTCTHVWNYAQGPARLFPDLERSVREFQDLEEGMDPDTGAITARGETVGSIPAVNALDGQAGAVLKAYREHLI